ncbi:hypothetical protein F2Q68_00009906 [Brassica cretica]|uniref:Uncharacterized protein n=1 Tax=Brassica cretica TaxID=69181 RepID=A0A8S9KY31_BRACR|nr:hypothetical protein F2Q68_00009906 [Brassica cretica]
METLRRLIPWWAIFASVVDRKKISCVSRCMPSSTRSNKDKHLLFSVDPAHLERTIRKDQRSTSLDTAAFTSTDSRTQPSTDIRPSSLTDLHRSTSIDTTPRTSIDHQSRNMVAIVILRQEDNGNLYDQDGHLRNATGQKLDAQGNVIHDTDATGAAQPVEEAARPRALADYNQDPAHLERTIRKDQRSTSLDAAAFTSTDSRTQQSTDTRPSSSTDLHRSTSIDTTPRTSIDHQSRNMVAIVILRQDENGNLYDQDGHLRNATDDDFWQVVKHEKLGEGDFEVESSMSFGGSHWCRPMSMDTHRVALKLHLTALEAVFPIGEVFDLLEHCGVCVSVAIGAVAAGVVLPVCLQSASLSFIFSVIVLIKSFAAVGSGTLWRTLVIMELFEFEVNPTVRSEVMPVLLKSGQSISLERAVEEKKECRSMVHPWCRSPVMPECGPCIFQDRLKPRSNHKLPEYPWTT